MDFISSVYFYFKVILMESCFLKRLAEILMHQVLQIFYSQFLRDIFVDLEFL